MELRPLGLSAIRVSSISLGTMTFGSQTSEAESHAQIDLALDRGINLLDAAEMYPAPPSAETQGATESIIGSWLAKDRGNRGRVVLATKVVGRGASPWIRDGNAKLDRANIVAALDASLQRLGTDYVDLYQLHWPDRKNNRFGELDYKHHDDPHETPIEETLGVLAELVDAGKVRAVGLSNETPWGVARFLQLAETAGLPRVVSIQNPYSLLNRSFDVGLAEMSIREQVGLLAYAPIAAGTLTGKYLDGAVPPASRRAIDYRKSRYATARADAAVRSYHDVARRFGLDPLHMSLAFVHHRPFVASAIIGATDLGQLQHALAGADLILSDEILQALDAVHVGNPNPCP
ncbi:NADP(H)-dependent aldo-keto reductase [Roseiterribacter gracilis]|uniref:Protein tas n=1 Tax=Roseiterribacter gracilis TaxID=2812848 RepID=A0A8S8XJS1_9PROT|nr:oxidoreductase [Rhodospirillales bacterium TMPK1]